MRIARWFRRRPTERTSDLETIAEAERLRGSLQQVSSPLQELVQELRAAVDQTAQLSTEIAARRRQDG
jgi:ABC-type transporter Mla subunit MlaD